MLSNLARELGVEIAENVPLSQYTTFQLGGLCPCVITCQTPDQLIKTVPFLRKESRPFVLFGGGSNLVVSDQGIDRVVIRYISPKPIIERNGNDLIVSGSTVLDQLALYAANQGLKGLNYTTGIPGTVGGAVVGNAGAFGQQVGDVTAAVTLISKTGETREALPQQLAFAYRYSNLRETDDIVVSVKFKMEPGDAAELLQERAEILAVRRGKHPNLTTHPCAGSFFRNIEPTSKAERRQAAGWFLEQAGGKGLSSGGAVIFDKHANIIVKSRDCTAQDVYNLSQKMAALVKQEFNLDLVREVKFVGRFEGSEESPASSAIIW